MILRLTSVCAVLAALVSVGVCQAQERKTPVEVKNTPNVAVTNTPSVTVANSPTVSVTNTPNVAIINSPTVKIDATANTVNATQLGAWNVGIAPTNNLVQTQVKSQKAMLFAQDTVVAANGGAVGTFTNCIGYKEARVVMFVATSPAVAEKLSLTFFWDGVCVGSAMWTQSSGYNSTITQHPGFRALYECFSIILPVFGDNLTIDIQNQSSTAITLNKNRCWVYLVN